MDDKEKILVSQLTHAINEMDLHGNLAPMRTLIEERWHGDYNDAQKIKFLKTMFGAMQVHSGTFDRKSLEPNYTIVKSILDNAVKKDIAFFIKATLDEGGERLTLDQLMHAHHHSRTSLLLVILFNQRGMASELISIIQAHWEISRTLTEFMKSLKPLLSEKDWLKFQQLKLSDEYRHIRNADSHLRISIDYEKKTIHIQDLKPRTQKMVWEKTLTYEEIMVLCCDIMKWVHGFIYAWQDVMNESIIRVIIENYEKRSHESR